MYRAFFDPRRRCFKPAWGAALEVQISATIAYLAILAVLISGAICIMSSAILLLHQWLPWWQAFGIAGLATLLVGIVSNAAMRPPTAVKTWEIVASLQTTSTTEVLMAPAGAQVLEPSGSA